MPVFLSHPIPAYVRISMIVAVGGLLFGMDTGTIGPVTNMASFTTTVGSFTSTIHGVLVSSILIPAALSSLVSGTIADVHGRPQTIMLGGIVFGAGAAMEAAAPSIAVFVCGRIIAGIGEGFFLSALTVYICEIAPTRLRGPLASLPQFGTVIGLASGYFVSYGTLTLNSSASWRLPLALQSFLAFLFAISCSLIPPSPRWLLARGRGNDATHAAARLGIDLEDIEMPSGSCGTGDRTHTADKPGILRSIRNTFKDFSRAFGKDVRSRTIFGCILMAMQQFAGIDGVLYYAPLLFQQAGLSSEQASFLASGVSAIVILVATVPATLLSDHWGRRSSTIWGGLVTASCMFLIGALYASGSVHKTHGAGRWVVIVTIYIFAIAYNASWAISIRIYMSEAQPLRTRATAASLGQSANWEFANFIVALTTPIFLDYSSFGAYIFFGACSFITALACVFLMPETRGRTLEEIDAAFQSHSWRRSEENSGKLSLGRKLLACLNKLAQ